MILTDTKHFSLEGTLKIPLSFPFRGEENHAVLSDILVTRHQEAELETRVLTWPRALLHLTPLAQTCTNIMTAHTAFHYLQAEHL